MNFATTMLLALRAAGIFAVGLGALHFFFPWLLDFRAAIPVDGPPLRPLRLPGVRYATTRGDVYGIALVMNHCVSYTIVSIGLADVLASRWMTMPAGRLVALWIAGFYAIRAASQFYLGRRRGDRAVMAGFAALAALHAVVFFAAAR
ncbi:MAG: hypothetical protein ABI780_00175 [Ardenticatenales bacterium]